MRFRGFWPPMLMLALVQTIAAQNPQQTRLVGVGTTSVLQVYSRWFLEFEKIRADVHFIYIPSGSVMGADLTTSGAADFGGTDVPLTNRQLAKARAFQMATLLVAIVPVYNVAGVTKPLKFLPQALAGIYLETITQWNDPAISGPNPQAQLPASKIVVIHSAAGRGSTYIWSDYLSKVSGEWKARMGRGMNIAWPVGKEAAGNGNVARMVKETQNSLGYVEVGYGQRSQLSIGQVQNAAGNFIVADISSISAAAAAANATPSDFHASITNPPGGRSYPICSFTWMIVAGNADFPAKQLAIKDFLRWMLNEGQTYVELEGFARLPTAIVEQEQRAIDEIP